MAVGATRRRRSGPVALSDAIHIGSENAWGLEEGSRCCPGLLPHRRACEREARMVAGSGPCQGHAHFHGAALVTGEVWGASAGVSLNSSRRLFSWQRHGSTTPVSWQSRARSEFCGQTGGHSLCCRFL